MRVLVIGGYGMLGHKLAQVFGAAHETVVTVRSGLARWPKAIPVAEVVEGADIRDAVAMRALIRRYKPDAVVNAAGVIKHVIGAHDPEETVAVNGTAPNLLAHICRLEGARLVHYSTDCVFTGSAASARGPAGYTEDDLPDAADLYGMTKYLGEPAAPALTIRTSIVGRELKGHHGLVEWFLSQGSGPVRGFKRALFTGLPTIELARVTETILREHPGLEGLWHVTADPIDKFALLDLVKAAYGRSTAIDADEIFHCDRRLDGSRFRLKTGWKPAAWPELIAGMASDPFDYSPYAPSQT